MHVLVLRFSAMGDVALTQPVIRKILDEHPDLQITFVSRPIFAPFFQDIPGLTFFPVNFKTDYKGIFGIFKLFKALKKYKSIDHVADLHSVMRTWILGLLFRLQGVPVATIDKGRAEKKLLVRKKNKVFQPLSHVTSRYAEVFAHMGLHLSNHDWEMIMRPSGEVSSIIDDFNLGISWPKSAKWIGIAPFSKHQQKNLPFEKIEELIPLIVGSGYHVLLFGGGQDEAARLEELSKKDGNVENIAGKMSLEQEMVILSNLDVMICMDSFNMHLAAIAGIKVISIWGATHPYAGFGPLGENNKYVIQIPHEELGCRPCSVYGNKPCWRGDLACLNNIKIEKVLEMIND